MQIQSPVYYRVRQKHGLMENICLNVQHHGHISHSTAISKKSISIQMCIILPTIFQLFSLDIKNKNFGVKINLCLST